MYLTTCLHVLETLRSSRLTYTLNETPYSSVYVTIPKKFTKEVSLADHFMKTQHAEENPFNEDILAKLVAERSCLVMSATFLFKL